MPDSDPTSAGSAQDPEGASAAAPELALSALLVVIGLLACVDIMVDLHTQGASLHVCIEAVVALLALSTATWLLRRLLQRTRELGARLAHTEAAARQWREDAQAILKGLGACIDAQFGRWGLSEAEKSTALLLLKGLSHKEIARARAISDATARQQAVAVYRKAGVNGRSELAAFFLEDLSLPRQSAAGVPASGTRSPG